MGMFDTIYCRVPLPDTDTVSDESFQTKDLDCLLRIFEIRSDGTIWEECYEKRDDEEYDLVREHEHDIVYWQQLTDFHQDIRFYGGMSPDCVWRNYIARFTNGKLERITYKDTKYD